MIAEFEKSHKNKSKSKIDKRKKVKNENKEKNQANLTVTENLFTEKKFEATNEFETSDINQTPERIIGATDENGELKFLIKWKSIYEPDLVPAKIANKKYAELVINFYEQRLCWDFSEIATSINHQDIKNAFEQGLEPNSIIGAASLNGQLMYLIDWKGGKEPDLVFSKLAKEKCPQLVIKFYQEQLILEDFAKN